MNTEKNVPGTYGIDSGLIVSMNGKLDKLKTDKTNKDPDLQD